MTEHLFACDKESNRAHFISGLGLRLRLGLGLGLGLGVVLGLMRVALTRSHFIEGVQLFLTNPSLFLTNYILPINCPVRMGFTIINFDQ